MSVIARALYYKLRNSQSGLMCYCICKTDKKKKFSDQQCGKRTVKTVTVHQIFETALKPHAGG